MGVLIVLKDLNGKDKIKKALTLMILRHPRFSGYNRVPGSVLNARDTVLAKQSRSCSLGSRLSPWEERANKHSIQTGA